MATDQEYMQRALELAEQGCGRVNPNPLVGCVIVRDDVVLGEGYHQQVGGPHAEVNAIASVRSGEIRHATVYVTLEPCTHQGRTPPCIDLLLEHEPARVVAAMEDPNPEVSGSGIARLREAGIRVDVGVLEEQARQQNEIFIKYITEGMPFVLSKCAMTLDGKIATRTGHSRWVTGEASRTRVHEIRNEVDAIVVGSRTVMIDNPHLTTRLDGREVRDPVRVIVDAEGELTEDRKIFHLDSEAPTWIATAVERAYPGAQEVFHLPDGTGGVDMAALMRELARREIAHAMIEGGGRLHAAAFDADVVDQVFFFVAPKIIGGHSAVTPVEGEGAETMDDAIALEHFDAERVGDDLLISAYVRGHGIRGRGGK